MTIWLSPPSPVSPLSDVDHLSDWERVLKTPLGAALKKALGEPLDDDLSEMH